MPFIQNVNDGRSRTYYGTGRDGAISRLVNTTEVEFLNCTSYTVNPSVTASAGASGVIAIFATQIITVDGGNISADAVNSNTSVSSWGATAASGVSGGQSAIFNQTDNSINVATFYQHFPLTPAFGLAGVPGVAGTTITTGSGGGGGAAYDNGGNASTGGTSVGVAGAPGVGGAGGGMVILCAPIIRIVGSGTITASGGSGGAGSGNSGGGGGGAGGTVVLICEKLIMDPSPIYRISSSGGPGGSSASGTGGPGSSVLFSSATYRFSYGTIGANSATPGATGGGSGGGGGAGSVIIMMPRTVGP